MDAHVEAILERVRKLLALAASSNPHEAALAAARAQSLIDQHRLEAWLGHDEDTDPIEDARDTPLEVARRLRSWKVVLAAALAEANGCLSYTTPQGADEAIVLVGRQQDRQAVAELWSWLVGRIAWLSATHGAGRSRSWHQAFRVGVVDAVAARLAEVSREAPAALSPAALMVIEPAMAAHRAALDRFAEEHLRLKKGRPLRVQERAWRAGQEAAAELPLRAPIRR